MLCCVRIGIVTKWLNRGQSYVARQTRSGLDEMGHDTFVLARPSRDRGSAHPHPGPDADGEWARQPDVTTASAWAVPLGEYEAWAVSNSLEAIIFDNCFQFDEIAALRGAGLRTAGRFVWEMFAPGHVPGALAAYDVVYSLTDCEHHRYAGLGIESLRVPWGVHPDLIGDERTSGEDEVRFYFPGGLMGPRKPRHELLEAFALVPDADVRLLIKAQSGRHPAFLRRAAADPRIDVIVEDMPTAEHRQLFASCDVCLAPSRWEGLGVFLYEAIGLGMPIITNDHPPMNEVVEHGLNGILVRSHPDGHAESGIAAVRPDVGELAAAIGRLRGPDLRAELGTGARTMRDRLSWDRTIGGLRRLVDLLG